MTHPAALAPSINSAALTHPPIIHPDNIHPAARAGDGGIVNIVQRGLLHATASAEPVLGEDRMVTGYQQAPRELAMPSQSSPAVDLTIQLNVSRVLAGGSTVYNPLSSNSPTPVPHTSVTANTAIAGAETPMGYDRILPRRAADLGASASSSSSSSIDDPTMGTVVDAWHIPNSCIVVGGKGLGKTVLLQYLNKYRRVGNLTINQQVFAQISEVFKKLNAVDYDNIENRVYPWSSGYRELSTLEKLLYPMLTCYHHDLFDKDYHCLNVGPNRVISRDMRRPIWDILNTLLTELDIGYTLQPQANKREGLRLIFRSTNKEDIDFLGLSIDQQILFVFVFRLAVAEWEKHIPGLLGLLSAPTYLFIDDVDIKWSPAVLAKFGKILDQISNTDRFIMCTRNEDIIKSLEKEIPIFLLKSTKGGRTVIQKLGRGRGRDLQAIQTATKISHDNKIPPTTVAEHIGDSIRLDKPYQGLPEGLTWEIPSLAILTGKNGIGKTQLLRYLNERYGLGSFIIDDQYLGNVNRAFSDTVQLAEGLSEREIISARLMLRQEIEVVNIHGRQKLFFPAVFACYQDWLARRKGIEKEEPIWKTINSLLERFRAGFTIESPELGSFSLWIKKNNHLIPFTALSSGEKVLFSLIARMAMIEKAGAGAMVGKVLLLDEIDTHFHPDFTKKFLDILQQMTSDPDDGYRVVMTTHNPATLALLKDNTSVFIMSKPAGSEVRIEQARSKRHAISELSDGLLAVVKDRRYITVENVDDVRFYSTVRDKLSACRYLSPKATELIFLPSGFKAQKHKGMETLTAKIDKLLAEHHHVPGTPLPATIVLLTEARELMNAYNSNPDREGGCAVVAARVEPTISSLQYDEYGRAKRDTRQNTAHRVENAAGLVDYDRGNHEETTLFRLPGGAYSIENYLCLPVNLFYALHALSREKKTLFCYDAICSKIAERYSSFDLEYLLDVRGADSTMLQHITDVMLGIMGENLSRAGFRKEAAWCRSTDRAEIVLLRANCTIRYPRQLLERRGHDIHELCVMALLDQSRFTAPGESKESDAKSGAKRENARALGELKDRLEARKHAMHNHNREHPDDRRDHRDHLLATLEQIPTDLLPQALLTLMTDLQQLEQPQAVAPHPKKGAPAAAQTQPKIYRIAPDHNAMYRAVIEGIRKLPEYSGNRYITLEELRAQVAARLRQHGALYRDRLIKLMPGPLSSYATHEIDGKLREREDHFIKDYITRIETGHAWGGQVELEVIAELLGVRITLHRDAGVVDPPLGNAASSMLQLKYENGSYHLVLPEKPRPDQAASQLNAIFTREATKAREQTPQDVLRPADIVLSYLGEQAPPPAAKKAAPAAAEKSKTNKVNTAKTATTGQANTQPPKKAPAQPTAAINISRPGRVPYTGATRHYAAGVHAPTAAPAAPPSSQSVASVWSSSQITVGDILGAQKSGTQTI